MSELNVYEVDFHSFIHLLSSKEQMLNAFVGGYFGRIADESQGRMIDPCWWPYLEIPQATRRPHWLYFPSCSYRQG
jgi:hypothetical protein